MTTMARLKGLPKALSVPCLELEIYSNRSEVDNSTSYDSEWVRYKGTYEHSKTKLFAASFCTNLGKRIVLHSAYYAKDNKFNPDPIADLDAEKTLIQNILYCLNQFPLTFGWYSTGRVVYDANGNRVRGRDSDFFILHQRCMFHHLKSPIIPKPKYTQLADHNKKHIDLRVIFGQKCIQQSVFEDRYRTVSLEAVSKALLGTGEDGGEAGKYGGYDAGEEDIASLPLQEQIDYAKRDSELTMLLAQHNDCLALRMMNVFSRYAELDYYTTCHTPISIWYANRYKKMLASGECTVKNTPNYKLEKQKIGGGHHTVPKRGFFVGEKVFELDVKGQYPRIVTINNFSFDTLNCTCCQYKPQAQVSQEIIDSLNEHFVEKGINRKVDKYWICQKQKGALPIVLEKTLADRKKYQDLYKVEQAKTNPNPNLLEEYHTHQLGAKIFANAGVGLFGYTRFDFANYKVNECVTAEGRRIHKQMGAFAQAQNFETVFGFTDSTFVRDLDRSDDDGRQVNSDAKVEGFIKACKDELDVVVELKTVFLNSIFYGKGKMNRLVGWTGLENDKPVIKGLEGLSDSYPPWIQRWFRKIVTELVKHPDTRFEVIPRMIREAYDELDDHCIDFSKELKYTQKLSKEPHEYADNGGRTKKLAELLGKNKGEVVWYYDTYKEEYVGKGKHRQCKKIKSYSVELEPDNLHLDEYKALLLRKLKDSLEITGFDVVELKCKLLESDKAIAPVLQLKLQSTTTVSA